MIVSYLGRPCLRMKFYPWVSCLRRHNRTPLAGFGFRGVVVWGECIPDAARGGVPPLQRLGALRGRSPRFACPVRTLGRLPLGGVYIGVGLWLGFRGNAPIPWGREYGWLGAGFPSQASLLQSGVPLFYTLKTGGVSAPALRIRHPNTPHSTRQCRARGINHPARFP